MEKKKNYQIAVLGSSNKGNYGHHLDIAFQGSKNAQITAIGDENKEGLIQKGRELKCINLYTNLEDSLKVATVAQNIARGTEDHKEGVRAFLEKRKPNFKGR